MKRAVFLDRDGTINAMVYNQDFGLVDSPLNPAEFQVLPGVGEAIRRINQMGFLVVVVSNQPSIAKGKLSLPLLEAITEKMRVEIAEAGGNLDEVYYCLHHPQGVVEEYRINCNCRKPKPGLLLRAAEELELDLSHSYMLGDGIIDVVAGQTVNATTIFLNNRKCYNCAEFTRQEIQFDYIAADLLQAVEIIQKIEGGSRDIYHSILR